MEKKLFSKRFPIRFLNLLSDQKQRDYLHRKCRIFDGFFSINPELTEITKVLVFIEEEPHSWLPLLPALVQLEKHCQKFAILSTDKTHGQLKSYLPNYEALLWDPQFLFGEENFENLRAQLRDQNFDSSLHIGKNQGILPLFLLADSGAKIRLSLHASTPSPYANFWLQSSHGETFKEALKALQNQFPKIFNQDFWWQTQGMSLQTAGEGDLLISPQLKETFLKSPAYKWIQNRGLHAFFIEPGATSQGLTKSYLGWNELRDRLKRSRLLISPPSIETEIALQEGICEVYLIDQDISLEALQKKLHL